MARVAVLLLLLPAVAQGLRMVEEEDEHNTSLLATPTDWEKRSPRLYSRVRGYVVVAQPTQQEALVKADQYKNMPVGANIAFAFASAATDTNYKNGYAFRDWKWDACSVVKRGCWSLNDMVCKDGTKCLKWGEHCFAGSVSAPPGVKVTRYSDWACSNGARVGEPAVPGIEPWDFIRDLYDPNVFSSVKFWDYDQRTCAMKFEYEQGWQCIAQTPFVGKITVNQPDEQRGWYSRRSFTADACFFIKKGYITLNDMNCEGQGLCLKWGDHCYAGSVTAPEEVTVKAYVGFSSKSEMQGTGTKTNGQVSYKFWNHDRRVCSFYFELNPALNKGCP